MEDSTPFASAAEFEAWLEANHATATEIWVALPRKGTAVASVTRHEALGSALCFGWIDGKAHSARAPLGWWAQRFTPRRPRSTWSKINCVWATKLIAAGRMRPAGLAQVEAAQADGRWAAAYDSPRTAVVPPDLQAALDACPEAAATFATLGSGARYEILVPLQKVKRPETRVRRIENHIAHLAAGQARPPRAGNP